MTDPEGPPAESAGSRRWLGLLVASAVLTTAAVLLWEPLRQRSPPGEPETRVSGLPDLTMTGAEILQFEADGSLKYRLEAERIRYFERRRLTRLEAPRLRLYDPQQPPWLVTSRHGYLRRRGGVDQTPEEIVYLRETVVLAQQFDDGRHLELSTEALYLYPDRRYAETDQDVMIDTNAGRTLASGLQGELDKGLMRLYSNAAEQVHSIVLPGQFK